MTNPGVAVRRKRTFLVAVALGTVLASSCADVSSVGPRAFTIGATTGLITVTAINVFPSTPALAGVTNVGFGITANHAEGRTLTFSWYFDDGTTATGSNVQHLFANPGNYSIEITVSDGLVSVKYSQSVTVKSMTGEWSGSYDGGFGPTFTIKMNQAGATLSGTHEGSDMAPGVLAQASLTAPRNISFQVREGAPGNRIVTFSGAADESLDRITGQAWSGTRTFELLRRQ